MVILEKKHLAILTILICFASFSAVLYTPALPQISLFFQSTDSLIQWTISLYLIGYAIGQLPYGPLANRLGRKKALFIGLSIALIGCILCLFANSLWVLCAGRFLQALGASAGLKLTFTMIGDCFKGAQAVKTISLITLSFAFAPGLAMALGGTLVTFFGWRGCFVFLTVYTIFLSLLSLLLPETHLKLDLLAFQKTNLIKKFKSALNQKNFLSYAMMYGFGTSIIYVFAAEAPYLGINQMKLSPHSYGLWSLIPSSGLALGLLFTNLAHQWSIKKGAFFGILITFLGICLWGFSLLLMKNPQSLFLPMIIVYMGLGITCTFLTSKILSSADDKSTVSALMGFINIGTAALSIFMTMPFTPMSSFSLITSLFLILFCQISLFTLLNKNFEK